MADNLSGVTEVASTIQDLISSEVQMVLNATVVIPGTIMEQPAGKGQKSVAVPRMGKFTVAAKVENTPVDAQVNAFAADKIDLDQYKVIQFLVEDIAELQSTVQVMQQYINQAGQDLAVDMDAYLISVVNQTSSAAPDHRLAFASGTSLTKADILNARALLNKQNVPLADRCAIISPDNESAILAIQEFTRVNEAGSASGLRNGEFGKLFGFTFMISSQVSNTASIFYHKSHAAMARQMAPKVDYFRDVPNLGDRWSISHLFGGKVMDGGKRGVLIGSAT